MARATTKRDANKPAPAKAPARRAAGAAASRPAPAPKLSKDELRAQIEKLERTVASLRAKNRELKRASGADAGRAEELERTVARTRTKAERSGNVWRGSCPQAREATQVGRHRSGRRGSAWRRRRGAGGAFGRGPPRARPFERDARAAGIGPHRRGRPLPGSGEVLPALPVDRPAGRPQMGDPCVVRAPQPVVAGMWPKLRVSSRFPFRILWRGSRAVVAECGEAQAKPR